MGGEGERLRILLFPWLAHGHITPFFQLAQKLRQRKFDVYLCSTPANFSSLQSSSIKLVELSLPSPPELPPHLHTTNGLPPQLMPKLKEAFDAASPSFLEILKSINPSLVIYDFLQPWAPEAAASLGVPSVVFLPTSACSSSFITRFFSSPSDVQSPFPNIHLRQYEEEGLKEMARSEAGGRKDSSRYLGCLRQSCNFVLMRTFREIEGKYIDYFSQLIGKKVVTTGPLVDCLVEENESYNEPEMMMMGWLKEKEERSTVFVSFGSEYFLREEEMEEVARGLELSGIHFVWVVRFPTGVEERLPNGFLQRVEGKGKIVSWAPQTRVLAHPAMGCAVSHCGWGSVMESLATGVPIIAVPMQLDQPMNARLVEELGVGVEVRRHEDGRLRGEDIAEVIQGMIPERKFEGIRERSKEMKDLIKANGELYVDEAVKELLRLPVNEGRSRIV